MTNETMSGKDPFDLNRFTIAQERIYDAVIEELKDGQKRSHWMWFIFPQIDGLGYSSTAKHYAIKTIEEARAYLSHPVLGSRLKKCAEIILTLKGKSASTIFGYPDDMKLRSSMTLFASIDEDPPNSVFTRVLDRYYEGEQDTATLRILEKLK